jgi:hypothetical protein
LQPVVVELALRIRVPAVAFPAHRRLDPILPQQVLERFSGILAAPIAVKEQSGLPRETTPEPGHLKRIHDQFLAQVIGQGPANHLAVEQIQNHRQIEPPLIRYRYT